MLNHFRGNLKKALLEAYPSLSFQPRVFGTLLFILPVIIINIFMVDWTKLKKRRECFDDYAKDRGFNPHIAENWYSISYSKLVEDKVSWSTDHSLSLFFFNIINIFFLLRK